MGGGAAARRLIAVLTLDSPTLEINQIIATRECGAS
jgi:hypothetical protein